MPSIFIWKSDVPNTSKKQIRYYSGSNWFLEDNDYTSDSYLFLDQIVIPGFNDSVITFRAKRMPQDWVGSELLEVTNVTYEQIKSDNYGTLERLGDWMRFISKTRIEFNSDSLQNELVYIKKWMSEEQAINNARKSVVQFHNYKNNHKHNNHIEKASSISQENVTTNFQEFFTKYGNSLPIPNSSNRTDTISTSVNLNRVHNRDYYKKSNTNNDNIRNKNRRYGTNYNN